MKNKSYPVILVSILIAATAFLRLINAEYHLYNLVPVAALGIFSGSILRNKKAAYLIPLAAMLLSDIGLQLFTHIDGFYGVSQFVNYIALALVTFIGTKMGKRNIIRVTSYTFSGSMVFFILSNLGTFLGGYYGYSLSGFSECYLMAIPFYKSEMATTFFVNSFAGDLAFSALAFGIYYLSSIRQNTLQVIR